MISNALRFPTHILSLIFGHFDWNCFETMRKWISIIDDIDRDNMLGSRGDRRSDDIDSFKGFIIAHWIWFAIGGVGLLRIIGVVMKLLFTFLFFIVGMKRR